MYTQKKLGRNSGKEQQINKTGLALNTCNFMITSWNINNHMYKIRHTGQMS